MDAEGDGSFVSVTNLPNGPARWSNFLEGLLFTGRLRGTDPLPFQPPPSLTPATLIMDVKDLTYSEQRNELIATTTTSILRIDPATMIVSEMISVNNNPGAIALSDDETVLWVALDDSNELQPFTYPQLQAGIASPLGDYSLPKLCRRYPGHPAIIPGCHWPNMPSRTEQNANYAVRPQSSPLQEPAELRPLLGWRRP